jgi:hypothetical protein
MRPPLPSFMLSVYKCLQQFSASRSSSAQDDEGFLNFELSILRHPGQLVGQTFCNQLIFSVPINLTISFSFLQFTAKHIHAQHFRNNLIISKAVRLFKKKDPG